MYKRQLQLKGVFPMVYNYNGQMIRMYSNQNLEFAASVRDSAERNSQYRSGKQIKKLEPYQPEIFKSMTEFKNKFRKKGDLKVSKNTKKDTKRQEIALTTTEMPMDVSNKQDFIRRILDLRNKNLLQGTASKTVKRNSGYPTPKLNDIVKTSTPTNNMKYSDDVSNTVFQSSTEATGKTEHSQEITESTFQSSEFTTVESVTMSTIDYFSDNTMQNDDGTTLNAQESASTLKVEQSESATVDYSYETTTMATTLMTQTSVTDERTPSIDSTTDVPIETPNNNEFYVSDAGIPNVAATNTFASLGQMSYFSDSNFDRFEDEYKMDQLTQHSFGRINLKKFRGDEKKVLRPIFRRKWHEIRKQLKDNEHATNDNNDPILMEILNNGK